MIAFPEVAEPRVSVVMVTHDAWEWIERSLAALARHSPPVYEVIVVDNASSPATVQRLEREVVGARLIRNAENEGFGPATNRGVAQARGEVLALLNSDLEVNAGWLEPLLEVLDGDAGCGAVAPRVLNLDGTLQEAGAIVARDGTTAKLGDGEPADAACSIASGAASTTPGPSACSCAGRRSWPRAVSIRSMRLPTTRMPTSASRLPPRG